MPVTIERPFEFFMPANQRSDGQQWITSSMRLLSMLARAGGPIAKALADLREVVWEKGPVRCGYPHARGRRPGAGVPRFGGRGGRLHAAADPDQARFPRRPGQPGAGGASWPRALPPPLPLPIPRRWMPQR